MQIHGIHARALANDIFWGAINRLEKKVTHLDSRVIFPRNASLALGTPGLVFFWQLARDDGAATTPTPRSGAGYRSGSDPRVSLKGHVRGGVEWRALSSVWLRWFCLVSVDFGFTAMTQGFRSNLCRSSHFWSFPRADPGVPYGSTVWICSLCLGFRAEIGRKSHS